MTEKDAVKWPHAAVAGNLPIYALRIEMAVEDEAGFMEQVLARVGGANARSRANTRFAPTP